MDHTGLEDPEALRLLLEDTISLARDARQLADLLHRLTFTVHRFAETYTTGKPDDPRHLLTEIGAVLERCLAVDLGRVGLEDALGSLRFGFVPNPSPHADIHPKELATLRERLARRAPPGRSRPRPQP